MSEDRPPYDVEEPTEEFRFRNPVKAVGYFQLYHAATLDPELSDGALRTYELYLMFAQQSGNCWPSRNRIAEMRHKDAATITRHNAELVKLGYITRQRRMSSSSITWIEDYEQNPRLQAIAEQMLEWRKNAPSHSAKMRQLTAQKCAVEEESIEEEPKKDSSPPSAADFSEDGKGEQLKQGLPELEYVDVDESGREPSNQPQSVLESKLASAVFARALTGPQRDKLKRPVIASGREFPSPLELFERDDLFRKFVDGLCANANAECRVARREKRKQPWSKQRITNAVRGYDWKKVGWLAYEARERVSTQRETYTELPGIEYRWEDHRR